MEIVVIAHNIRSAHNIGSIFRTCDGLGVNKLYLSGYSPYPLTSNDTRLPHIAAKLTAQINKTALGAEQTVQFEHATNIDQLVAKLKKNGFELYALEQDTKSTPIYAARPAAKTALLLGEEVNGIEPDLLKMVDHILEIPMYGQKESFNVSVATGIALYALKEHKHYGIIASSSSKTKNEDHIQPQSHQTTSY